MRFGTFVPQGWKTDQRDVPLDDQWDRILTFASLIEETGYDSIWVYDHFHTHPKVTDHCEEVGWDFNEIGRTCHFMSVVGRDQGDLDRKLEIAASRRASRADEFRDEHLAVTVGHAVNVLGQFEAEGCTDIRLYFYDMGMGDSLELFASQVIPQLR